MALPPHLKDLAARVSNWGRWGEDDQRGTLNLIDEAAVLRGVAAARQGKAFSLAIPFDEDGPQTGMIPGRDNPERTMIAVNRSYTGDTADFCATDDRVSMGIQAATHWDGLAHAGYEEQYYNGVPFSAIDEAGCHRLGIDNVGPLVSRGVLLDVARAHGVDRFDDGHPITGDDLDAAAALGAIEVQPGDVLMVRTGQMAYLADDGGGRDNITAVVVDVVSVADLPEDEVDDDGTVLQPGLSQEIPVPRDPTAEVPVIEEDTAADEPRARRLTWRVAAFLVALLLLVALVVGALGWYARKTYFVAIDDEQVTIFKGRPGGFLWFDPTVEQVTEIPRADVPDAELADLEGGVDQPTLGDAENYVENLRAQIDQLAVEDGPSTTPTTTEAPTGGGDTGDSGTKPPGND